jgi:Rieske Fe-S protein
MMPGEDQERLEDYLELEHFLEELQAGRVAHPPEGLTPEKARIYRMAALLRSAVPDEAAPRAEFAAELQAKLEQEVKQPSRTRHLPLLAKKPQGRARVSRRALLAGGAAAVAASLAAGAGLEHVVEQASHTAPPPASQWSTPIVPAGIASTWLFVTTFADLGDKAVRFASDAVVGYVIRNDGEDKAAGNEPVVAVSAACTHMGCIVQWQDADHTFHCPCHGGLFTEYGMIDKHSPLLYLKPLPRLETKVEEGKVFVRVPASQTS